MTDLTFNHVRNEVLRLADENPDHVYAKPFGLYTEHDCLYVHPEGGGCIFGQALLNLGISRDVLSQEEGLAASLVIEAVGIHDADERDCGWANEVQEYQDRGMPWGEAVSSVR